MSLDFMQPPCCFYKIVGFGFHIFGRCITQNFKILCCYTIVALIFHVCNIAMLVLFMIGNSDKIL
jgi:hypothetical protein